MRLTVLLAGLVLLSGFCGCSSDDNDDPTALDLRGHVTGASGQAIPDAIIQLGYRLEGLSEDPHEDPVIDDDLGSCRIPVSIDEDGVLHVWVTRHGQSEVVASVMHGQIGAGSYDLFWNKRDTSGMLVASGIYDVHVEIDESSSSCAYLINNSYDDCWYLNELCCVASTDEEGWFSINQRCLAFNCLDAAALFGEDGELLTGASFQRSVRLWVMHDNYYKVCVDSVYVDPEQGATLEIGMTLLPYGR